MLARTFTLVLIFLIPAARVWAQESAAPARPSQGSSAITVPADTRIPLSLKNSVNTKTAYVGQAIYCETIYPITVGNRVVIPVGTYVKGAVTQVVRPGRIKGKGQIGLRFDSMTLPNGTTTTIRATLSAYSGNGNQGFIRDESKIQGESSKKGDAATIARTTATGAEIGTIAGVAGHSVGKGLGIGSGAGAAGGLIWVLATRGKKIVIPAGTSLELELISPLTFQEGELDPRSPGSNGSALPRRDPGPGI
jgi:hypothetical protein